MERSMQKITRDELTALGHAPTPVPKAVRRNYLDCCNGSAVEVRHCAVTSCALYPFRFGKNPWRATKVLSDEHRRALVAAGRGCGAQSIQLEGVAGEMFDPGGDTSGEMSAGVLN